MLVKTVSKYTVSLENFKSPVLATVSKSARQEARSSIIPRIKTEAMERISYFFLVKITIN